MIVSASQRLAERRGAKILIAGPTGVGKTSLLRTVDPARTLFLDVEAGDLSVQDVPIDTIRIDDWSTARDIACRIGGPNPSFPASACYSAQHFAAAGEALLPNLDRYDSIFVDSITAISRLSFRHAEQQPEALTSRGAKDLRAVYGLHARELLMWLHQLQHTREKNVILVGILERAVDDFGRAEWRVQLEGAKTGRELPGIIDEVITMQFIDFGDGKPVRAFVCTQPNQWGYPAKDRSGRLEQIEEPHLGKLLQKLVGPGTRKPFAVAPLPPSTPEQQNAHTQGNQHDV
jgi:hypothetical protein